MANEIGVAGKGEAPSPERRRFLGRLSIALSAIAAAVVGVPVVGFILGPLISPEEPVWREVGRVANFQISQTVKVSDVRCDGCPRLTCSCVHVTEPSITRTAA
jgi:hypothetical protein